MKSKIQILGIILLLIGLILIATSSFNITGAFISEGIIEWTSSFIGLVLVIFGLVIFISKGLEDSINHPDLEVIPTNTFLREIKRLTNEELKLVQQAIQKIGTGKGNEKKLKGDCGYEIRSTKGRRVIFNYDDDGNVYLTNYLPKKRYNRLNQI